MFTVGKQVDVGYFGLKMHISSVFYEVSSNLDHSQSGGLVICIKKQFGVDIFRPGTAISPCAHLVHEFTEGRKLRLVRSG